MSSPPTIVVFDVGNVLIEWDMRHVYRKIFDNDECMEQLFEETGLISWNINRIAGAVGLRLNACSSVISRNMPVKFGPFVNNGMI